MKIGDIGEFGLIQRVAKAVPPAPSGLIIGIGDDAAAWRTSSGIQLATTDTLIENVHFKLGPTTWYDLGWKALAVNLSDIAAMGGIARYALVTLGLPNEAEVQDVLDFYKGLSDLASRCDTAIAGGDMVSSPAGVMITVSVIGEASVKDCLRPSSHQEACLLRRSASRPGDLVGVTGFLGTSASGLEMIMADLSVDSHAADVLRTAHLRPTPRLAEGRALVAAGVQAAMDISDGLVGDLTKLCEASRVAARVWSDRIPIHPTVTGIFGARAIEQALYGGEDYELLFAAPRETMEVVTRSFAGEALSEVTVIGEIMEGPAGHVAVVASDGTHIETEKGGWDHFAR
ncbi:MAG: thiamine-phosphate kinase [Chloroflexi bacterium]|nr:thiamine-phosphate kinase [Chloroflexota bacterium]